MKSLLHFRNALLTLVSFLLMSVSVTSQTTIDGFFYSPSLDQTRMVDIYLPPGYDANPDLHYPVIYYLHGWGGNQNFLSTITSNATQKINSGEINPVIIVCASNYTSPFNGSMYMNSPVHGDYEDYMINDLITWLDTTYRTVPSKEYRTVMGHSMGGYGAFRYGILHKDKFSGLAAHAAPANLRVIIDDFENQIESENSGPPYSYNYNATGNFTKMIFLGAGVWSPNLNTPQNYITPASVEYPFDQQCEVIDTVFDKWDQHQVTALVKTLSSSDSVGILFGCGTGDELYFNVANNALKDTLDGLSIDYEYYSHSGGHILPTGFKNRALVYLDSLMMPPTTLPDPPSDTTQNIQLLAGWNIHSFFVTPENQDMLDIHEDLINSGDLIKIVDEGGGFIQDIPGIGWMNTIGDMQLNKGYYIKVDPTTQLNVTGTLSGSSCEISLSAGWNIIGYPIVESQNALSAVQPLIDNEILEKVMSENGGAIIDLPGIGWINTIGNFEPGEGYYIKVSDNSSLTLSCPPAASISGNSYEYPEPVFLNAYEGNPYNPMNIIIQDIAIDGFRIQEGDEIGVYDGDILVGAGVVEYKDGQFSANIVAAMDDPTTDTKDGFSEGKNLTFKYLNDELETPIEIYAISIAGESQFDALGTYVASLTGSVLSVEENEEKQFSIGTYPNPAADIMSIGYSIPEGNVYMGIVNLNGSRVKDIMNEYHEKGDYSRSLEINDLSPGFYVLQVRVVTRENILNEYHKFIKQ